MRNKGADILFFNLATQVKLAFRQIRFASVLSILLIVIAAPDIALAQNAILPPGAAIAGRSPGDLSVDWWKWALERQDDESPVSDRTGKHCGQGQSGEVWFLAGGYGRSKIRRFCTLPESKTLFFPMINMISYTPKADPDVTCNDVKEGAQENNETTVDLFAEVDGVAVQKPERYRVKTETCFKALERHAAKSGGGDGYPAASDGFWIAVAPLPPGRHKIRFGGRYNNSGAYGHNVQDIEYELDVK